MHGIHHSDLEYETYSNWSSLHSAAIYRRLIEDMPIRVDQQVLEAGVVSSRFVVTGMVYRKRVRFASITIIRFENGRIAEDWSHFSSSAAINVLVLSCAGFAWGWRNIAVGWTGSC